MKKKIYRFLIAFIFSFFSPLAFSQASEHQVLIPHQVYVGDTANLTLSFQSKIDFFSNSANLTQNLSVQNFDRPVNEKEFSVNSITLSKNPKMKGDQFAYTITIQFIPWTPGKIKFPPLRLEKDFVVIPSEINIDSIFSVTKKEKSFAGPIGPFLIPGTTYRLLFRIITLIIFSIILIFLLIRWQKVSLFYKNLKLKILYARNKKQTLSQLEKLLTNNLTDKENSENLQSIMRKYLDTRFSFCFSNCTTSEIMKGFYNIFQGLLSEQKESAAEDLTGIFMRTDFIRYSKDATFNKDELNELINQIKAIIQIFETPEADQ